MYAFQQLLLYSMEKYRAALNLKSFYRRSWKNILKFFTLLHLRF